LGKLQEDYFEPIVIPTVEHITMVEKNIPIPPGIYDEVIKIIKEKIKISVYERSICLTGPSVLCPQKGWEVPSDLHDLQPLNAVTIQRLRHASYS